MDYCEDSLHATGFLGMQQFRVLTHIIPRSILILLSFIVLRAENAPSFDLFSLFCCKYSYIICKILYILGHVINDEFIPYSNRIAIFKIVQCLIIADGELLQQIDLLYISIISIEWMSCSVFVIYLLLRNTWNRR